MSAYDQASILINRCKRILALVDTYVEKQTAATRTDLRSALMDEFKAPAIAPPLAAGSVGTPNLTKVIETLRRERDESEAKLRERAEKAEAKVVAFRREAIAAINASNGSHMARQVAESRLEVAEARMQEMDAQLARRGAPLSPEMRQAIAAARAAGQTVAATPGGLIFMNDGAEPGSSELDCPACGGSGHAGDVAASSSGSKDQTALFAARYRRVWKLAARTPSGWLIQVRSDQRLDNFDAEIAASMVRAKRGRT